jgi:hypothetical protein
VDPLTANMVDSRKAARAGNNNWGYGHRRTKRTTNGENRSVELLKPKGAALLSSVLWPSVFPPLKSVIKAVMARDARTSQTRLQKL